MYDNNVSLDVPMTRVVTVDMKRSWKLRIFSLVSKHEYSSPDPSSYFSEYSSPYPSSYFSEYSSPDPSSYFSFPVNAVIMRRHHIVVFWTILLYMCACVVKITELSIGIFRVSSRWRTCVSHWSYLQFFCENISTPFYLFVIDTQLWERIFHGDEMEIRCAEMSNFMSLLSLYTCRITQCTFELVLMGRLSVAT